MSSAGRGPRLGGQHDWFPTPRFCVDRLLEAWTPRPGVWVEPCAGDGAIIKAAPGDWLACEIREEARPHLEPLVGDDLVIGDWLLGEFGEGIDERLEEATLILSNPPYVHAAAFIDACIRRCPHADIALLLRMGIVETPERGDFFRACCPDVYALPQRPSFIAPKQGNKLSTDSATYGWFVWEEAKSLQTVGTFQVLGPTSLAEKKKR